MPTKTDYCPFCSALTELHPLVDASGKTWWACQTVTNPALPGYTCYSGWQQMLTSPPKLALSDF